MNTRLFGCVVCIESEILVVGVPSVGTKGSVNTYKINDRQVEEVSDRLLLKDGHIDDGFGICCKLILLQDCYRLIVGAHRKYINNISIGVACIYECNKYELIWNEICELESPVKNQNTSFGSCVSINNDIAVVGAYGDNTDGYKSGAIHIYKETLSKVWTHTKTLYPGGFYNPQNANISSSFYFGFSLEISDNFILVGAPSEYSRGSAYVFYSYDNSWNESIDSYCITDEYEDTHFGFSVDINSDKIVIGAPGKNGESGRAYVYDISSIFDLSKGFLSYDRDIPSKIINTKSRSSKSLFGRSVSLDDKFIAVSGFGKVGQTDYMGSAFLYAYNLYTEQDEIEPLAYLRDKEAEELFGHSIDISEQYIVIGDPSANKVHIYSINSLIGGPLKQWNWSNKRIEAPQQYELVIN
tara:strand:+ start:10097 stop:11329 length:1233 start_codon:yes stop_codon:yes gene_type:complete